MAVGLIVGRSLACGSMAVEFAFALKNEANLAPICDTADWTVGAELDEEEEDVEDEDEEE